MRRWDANAKRICRKCGAQHFWDAECCPECGSPTATQPAATDRRPVWWVAVVMLLVILVLCWYVPRWVAVSVGAILIVLWAWWAWRGTARK